MTGSLPPNGSHDPDSAASTSAEEGALAGEWVEVYPPGGEPDEPEQMLDPEPRSRIGPLVTGLFGASLVLVLLGSVLPLFQATLRVSFRSASSINVAAWQFTSSSLAPDRELTTHDEASPVPVGYPLIVAGLLLTVAVALWLRSGWRPSSTRPAKLVGIVAATFLAALVFALGMFELAWQNLLGGAADTTTVGGLVTGVGEGFWLLVLGALAAIAAVTLSLRIPGPPEPDERQPDWSSDSDPVAERPPGQPADWPVVAVLPADERSSW